MGSWWWRREEPDSGSMGDGKTICYEKKGMYLMCNVYGFIISNFMRFVLLFLEISPIFRVCCCVVLSIDDH